MPERRRTASVGSISSSEVRKYRDGLVEAGLSQSTANVELVCLRSLFNDARRQGIVVVNPAEAIPKLQAHDVDERVPFTTEQIRALLKAADSEWQGMILLGCHAGLRIGDAANLRWSNIDLMNRTLSFEAQKTSRRKKKHDRVTKIFMHDDLLDYLDRAASSDDANAPLFPSLHGTGTSGSLGLSAQFVRGNGAGRDRVAERSSEGWQGARVQGAIVPLTTSQLLFVAGQRRGSNGSPKNDVWAQLRSSPLILFSSVDQSAEIGCLEISVCAWLVAFSFLFAVQLTV